MHENLHGDVIEIESWTPPLPTKNAPLLHWNDYRDRNQKEESPARVGPTLSSSFQAKDSLPILRIRPYLTTNEIDLAPSETLRKIVWKQEAKLLTFSLDPILLTGLAKEEIPRITNSLVWAPCRVQPSLTLSVHPILRVSMFYGTYPTDYTDYIEIAPSLREHDPLLQHIALVLQTEIEEKGIDGRCYVETLVDALATHFLRRYKSSRRSPQEMTGGLSPYKLRRTTAYIREHLEQELSLATLAAVGKMSPAHFARLFKQATGLTPHQYVITRRMEQAKRLLTETDLPLSEIGLQVGCADQSHFTALFRSHVSLTPKAYRDHTQREDLTTRSDQATVP